MDKQIQINDIKDFFVSKQISDDGLLSHLDSINDETLSYFHNLIMAKNKEDRLEIINNYVWNKNKQMVEIKTMEKKMLKLIKNIEEWLSESYDKHEADWLLESI